MGRVTDAHGPYRVRVGRRWHGGIPGRVKLQDDQRLAARMEDQDTAEFIADRYGYDGWEVVDRWENVVSKQSQVHPTG